MKCICNTKVPNVSDIDDSRNQFHSKLTFQIFYLAALAQGFLPWRWKDSVVYVRLCVVCERAFYL